METREWRFVDRSNWLPGPWDEEPDKAQWVDERTGLPCLAHRGGRNAWCGYVGVPPGHPLHGVDCADLRHLLCHGGLNASGPCSETDEDGRGVCHVPGPGEPDPVWWLGFDCDHGYDYAPLWVIGGFTMGGPIVEGSEYRTLAYVRDIVGVLALQVANAKPPQPVAD